MSIKKISAAVYTLWIVLFTVMPLLFICVYAFGSDGNGFTFDNMRTAAEYAPVLIRSIVISLAVSAICLAVAYPVSFSLAFSFTSGKTKRVVMALIILPVCVNFLLRTYSIAYILDNNGLINMLLTGFGLQPLKMLNTQGALILGLVYNSLPMMVLPVFMTMNAISRQICEAARDLGTTKITMHAKVIAPLCRNGIKTGFMLTFIPTVSIFAVAGMLGGGKSNMIGDVIEMYMTGSAYNPYVSSALSLVLLLLLCLMMVIIPQTETGGGYEETGME